MDSHERVALALETLAKKIEDLIDFQRTMIPLRLVYPLMLAMFLSFAGGAGVKALYRSLGLPVPNAVASPSADTPVAGDNDPASNVTQVPMLARDYQPR